MKEPRIFFLDEAMEAQKRGEKLQWRDGTRAVPGWHDCGDVEITEYHSDFEFRIKPKENDDASD